MDLRVKKTKSAIINSFLELRSKKPLERITVKELSDLAQINKATFYLHYKDIYDLSESLEEELLDNVLDRISHPNAVLSEPKIFIRELIDGFVANQTLIDIIFSNDRRGILVDRLESKVREFLFENYPQCKDVPEINLLLSYTIKGGFYAFTDNIQYDTDTRSEIISEMADVLAKSFLSNE